MAPISPAPPSEMTSSGSPSPLAFRRPKNPAQASVDSALPGSRPSSTGLPAAVIPQATSTGSAGAAGCILKKLPSANRYSSSRSARLRVFQTSNSSLICSQMRLTVDLDTVACGPSASARLASTSRTDRPRTNPAITSDSSALVRVTPLPSSRDANAVSVPRSLGRARVTSPAVVLTDRGV
jgi:hypothetical protein